MPELLNNTPDKQPPTGGSMFSAEEIAALQANLDASRQRINANTNAEIADMLRSGTLGKTTPDLEMPDTADSRISVSSGIRDRECSRCAPSVLHVVLSMRQSMD